MAGGTLQIHAVTQGTVLNGLPGGHNSLYRFATNPAIRYDL